MATKKKTIDRLITDKALTLLEEIPTKEWYGPKKHLNKLVNRVFKQNGWDDTIKPQVLAECAHYM